MHEWNKILETERIPIYELAKRCRMSRERMGKILCMTFLAPDIIKAIFDGTYPKTLSLNKITEHEIPLLWSEQRKINPIFLIIFSKVLDFNKLFKR